MHLKSVRKKNWQLLCLAILQLFLAFFFQLCIYLMVNLKGSMCLNPNWIKIYDLNHKLFLQVCFSILEEKEKKIWVSKMVILGPFLVIFLATT